MEDIIESNYIENSVFRSDFDFDRLRNQLAILVVVHESLPSVKEVTSTRTICEAIATKVHANRKLLTEIHKLLRLYLTIPITSRTSERSFSALRRLFNYLRATMSDKRLNNCLTFQKIAKEFVSPKDERKKYFGNFDS